MQEFPHALPVVQILQQRVFLLAASVYETGMNTIAAPPIIKAAATMSAETLTDLMS